MHGQNRGSQLLPICCCICCCHWLTVPACLALLATCVPALPCLPACCRRAYGARELAGDAVPHHQGSGEPQGRQAGGLRLTESSSSSSSSYKISSSPAAEVATATPDRAIIRSQQLQERQLHSFSSRGSRERRAGMAPLPPAAAERAVFVTVGTTKFDALIRAVDQQAFADVLVAAGYTRLVMQIGRWALLLLARCFLFLQNSELICCWPGLPAPAPLSSAAANILLPLCARLLQGGLHPAPPAAAQQPRRAPAQRAGCRVL